MIQETKEISDKIQDTLKLEPVEKDVIVLYENDKVASEYCDVCVVTQSLLILKLCCVAS